MKRIVPLVAISGTLLMASCVTQTPIAHPEISKVRVIPSVPVDENGPSFPGIPVLERPVVDTQPADRKDGLVTGELGVDGGQKAVIVELAQEIADGQHGKIDSLLIVHKGKLLFESYYRRGRVNLTHPQASATKSYTSFALGRAIQLGYLTMEDLNKPLISFFNTLDQRNFVDGVDTMTLHKVLSMRSGVRISDQQKDEFENNPSQIQGQRLVQNLLQKSAPISEENTEFSYGNYSSDLTMQVINAVVPGTAEDFIRHQLFGEMGITAYSWQSGMSGLPAGGWKSSISSRAMAKFGIVAANNGRWKGKQLIAKAYVTKATSRVLTTGDDDIFGGGEAISNQGYGYFWWNADMKVGDKSYFSASAQGGGGQYITLVNGLDLIVVVTGHEGATPTLQIMAERILPAFIES